MATVQQWGRKESIIWPPRGYVSQLRAVRSIAFVIVLDETIELEQHAFVRFNFPEKERAKRIYASVMVNESQRLPSPVAK